MTPASSSARCGDADTIVTGQLLKTIKVRKGQQITVPSGSTTVTEVSCIGVSGPNGSTVLTFRGDGDFSYSTKGPIEYYEANESVGSIVQTSAENSCSSGPADTILLGPCGGRNNAHRLEVGEMTLDEDTYSVIFFPQHKTFSPDKAWAVAVWDTSLTEQGMTKWQVCLLTCRPKLEEGRYRLPPEIAWTHWKNELQIKTRATFEIDSKNLRDSTEEAAEQLRKIARGVQGFDLEDYMDVTYQCGKGTKEWDEIVGKLVDLFLRTSKK